MWSWFFTSKPKSVIIIDETNKEHTEKLKKETQDLLNKITEEYNRERHVLMFMFYENVGERNPVNDQKIKKQSLKVEKINEEFKVVVKNYWLVRGIQC
jgi:hypothetical protein